MIDQRSAEARDRFRAAIGRGLVLLDAAMGTRLLALGLRLEDDDPCLWNLAQPGAVAAIHDRDVAAGSQALLTNTFGANRSWLARLGRVEAVGERVAEINRAAVALARRAAGSGGFVVGDIGPTATEGGAVAEQAAHLIDAGVEALILETHRLDQAESALRQIERAGGARVPVLVSLIAWPDPPDAAVARLETLGASALGGNCQDGMGAALDLVERLRPTTALPLIVKPAAGRPGGPIDAPEAFAKAVPRLRALVPVLVGGCCGTTESHLAALKAAWYDERVPGA
jgi:5-methyltetrahydrofolate--homocysteine methyltransferase